MSEKERKIDGKRDPVGINLRIAGEVYASIKEYAKETGEEVEELISKILGKSLKEQFVEEERRKEIGHIIGDLSVEELESEVLEFFKTNPTEFAFGSESKVYKMKIPNKKEDVLVVKRKYKGTSLDEFDIHNKVKDLEFLSKQQGIKDIHIPALFHHFNKEGEEYILMEYIKGKTLYLMIIEAILSQETIEYGDKIKDLARKKEFYYVYYSLLENKKLGDLTLNDFERLSITEIKELLSDENGYLKDIRIESDLIGENLLKYLYSILKEEGLINIDVNSEMDLGGLKINKFLFEIINRHDFSKLKIFSNTQALYLSKNINSFLSYMHKNGIYHRDLGANTRNIIITPKEDGLYKATIIDFGKSKIFDSKIDNREAYLEENGDGSYIRYVNDEMITSNYIDKLSGIDNKTYKLLDKEKENILNKLFIIGKKYGVNSENIKNHYNFIVNNFKNRVHYNSLVEILFSRKMIGGYELNLSNTKNKDLKNEREVDKRKILSKIIVLMYLTKKENFEKIGQFIDKLEKDNKFKPSRKKEYIKLYRDIFHDIKNLRKYKEG